MKTPPRVASWATHCEHRTYYKGWSWSPTVGYSHVFSLQQHRVVHSGWKRETVRVCICCHLVVCVCLYTEVLCMSVCVAKRGKLLYKYDYRIQCWCRRHKLSSHCVDVCHCWRQCVTPIWTRCVCVHIHSSASAKSQRAGSTCHLNGLFMKNSVRDTSDVDNGPVMILLQTFRPCALRSRHHNNTSIIFIRKCVRSVTCWPMQGRYRFLECFW